VGITWPAPPAINSGSDIVNCPQPCGRKAEDLNLEHDERRAEICGPQDAKEGPRRHFVIIRTQGGGGGG
jgi:hypothetical protein